MSATLIPNRPAAVGQVRSKEGKERADKVPLAIWQLQDEVKILQEELARTRRALEQREVLLRNAQQRAIELRAEAGAGRR